MFRLPVFGILLTAVLLSLPGPAGASFAVTEYAPVLSRLYKDKQSPLASSYRISFDKSKSSAPCLTAYTLTGTAAELIRYDCPPPGRQHFQPFAQRKRRKPKRACRRLQRPAAQ